jgi:hypothetical protein
VPGEELPRAQKLAQHLCDVERASFASLHARRDADEKAGKPFDKAAELAAANETYVTWNETKQKLAALPGSTFDKDTWKAFVQSEEWVNTCERVEDDDEK